MSNRKLQTQKHERRLSITRWFVAQFSIPVALGRFGNAPNKHDSRLGTASPEQTSVGAVPSATKEAQ
jgi:hypothetical protein